MKLNLIKKFAIASIVGLTAFGTSQAAVIITRETPPPPKVVKTCYIGGRYVGCTTRYYRGVPYFFYRGNAYRCNPSGCFPVKCPGGLC